MTTLLNKYWKILKKIWSVKDVGKIGYKCGSGRIGTFMSPPYLWSPAFAQLHKDISPQTSLHVIVLPWYIQEMKAEGVRPCQNPFICHQVRLQHLCSNISWEFILKCHKHMRHGWHLNDFVPDNPTPWIALSVPPWLRYRFFPIWIFSISIHRIGMISQFISI